MTGKLKKRIAASLQSDDSSKVIAVVKGKEKTEQDYAKDVACLIERLGHSTSDCVLYADCAYAFLVGLTASLLKGFKTRIPGDLKPTSFVELSKESTILLTDTTTEGFGFTVEAIFDSSEISNSLETYEICSETIELSTSGSSGQPKLVSKSLAVLEEELSVHEQLWSERVAEAWIAGTVSQQHIYGFLFRVLWPFLEERVFVGEQLIYPEDFYTLLKLENKFALIASPALLRRLPDLVDISDFRNSIAVIFSSGGSLKQEVATTFEELGVPTLELYGSTETGGIAWRSLASEISYDLWRLLPGISMQLDEITGCLAIASPFIPGDSYYLTSDLVELCDDVSFKLLGRADRIVKIEEKRIALPGVEELLERSVYVADAVALPISDTSSERIYLATILALNPRGIETLRSNGRKFLIDELRSELNDALPSVAVPKRWKFVTKLERNSQGKLELVKLKDTFEVRTDVPIQEQVEHSQNQVRISCRVPKDLAYFEGHFPNYPVVPGFVQLDWALYFAREHFAIPFSIKKCTALKFNDLMLPEAECELSLSVDHKKNLLKFVYEGQESKFSSGKVYF